MCRRVRPCTPSSLEPRNEQQQRGSLYEVLQVKRNVSLTEIKTTYRSQAKLYHLRDLDDIFLHPFFMTPKMHQAFVSNMNILAYKPNVTGDMDTTMVKRQSLRKLAIEFHKSWIWKAARRNET
ncbi:hypothetical protein RHSIM_Rhsim06G0217700 [Rhododendron simsii]|uniref:J domain-containing protein n=1 Tax=Rhododendron simsii TaxID=118357 RepID=A0A834GTD4_RHOSS|nr:hypothetical protein RHSIM_Rhsim06G0217700 [Rhododendron simsii]